LEYLHWVYQLNILIQNQKCSKIQRFLSSISAVFQHFRFRAFWIFVTFWIKHTQPVFMAAFSLQWQSWVFAIET
jgi:hypothetical protein